jgi:hypothetical protein
MELSPGDLAGTMEFEAIAVVWIVLTLVIGQLLTQARMP